GVRALSAGHAGGHPLDGGEIFRGEPPHNRDARDQVGDEMMIRRIALAVVVALLAQAAPSTQSATVLQPGSSPLIVFRIMFTTGWAFDPPGKEGLASLTAAMVGEAGSRTMTYQQIVEAMYPMATSVGWQVDKEMTVFTGTTHVENLDRFYA